ncbi:hypothetical protein [Streptomyces carpaticus]|uniref:Uncharacterized protein n=1 Tax=Streptomyces carpaticus TaxID=285558 RepID=A0ABV4ZPQ9_9ACTN
MTGENGEDILAGGPDAAARLRILADGYGLGTADPAALPRVVEQATQRGREFVTRRVDW